MITARQGVLAASTVVASLAAWPAWANAGVGYFMVALPIVVVAFPLAVLLEGFVLSPMLAVPIKRGFQLSFGANLRSTLWGFGLGIAIDALLLGAGESSGLPPVRAAATSMLVLFFLLSWAIEDRFIRRQVAWLTLRRVVAATGAANLLSYAAMIAFAWIMFPEHDPMMTRAQVSEAVSLMGGAKTALTEYFADHEKWPDSLDQVVGTTNGRYTQSIVISKGAGGTGQIELTGTIGSAGIDPEVAGKTVLLLSTDKGKSWTCRPGTLAPKYLPVACR